MAIRPEISLAVQQANVAPAISTFLNVRNAQQQAALQPLRQQLLEQQAEGAGLQNELTRFGIQTEKDAQDLRSVAQFATQHQSVFEDGDPATLLPTLDARIATITRQGGDPAQSIELRDAINNNPEQSRNMALGAIKLSGLLPQASAGTRERELLLTDLQSSDPQRKRSAEIQLGLTPRAGISAQERIAADPTLTTQVAGSQAEIEAKKKAQNLVGNLSLNLK